MLLTFYMSFAKINLKLQGNPLEIKIPINGAQTQTYIFNEPIYSWSIREIYHYCDAYFPNRGSVN